jgi:hypothetical protein
LKHFDLEIFFGFGDVNSIALDEALEKLDSLAEDPIPGLFLLYSNEVSRYTPHSR